ncbi:hypothetical protein TNCV_241871 [Trichonephila clavipes]|uniref:Uncharacterized protein n=1 Tax=Trichonephila clavipes TaxID=2585209 RepID=A0A8X7BDD2_TRICX|nr:hypothetical protein TNCV_241871 [Trichonephila clavipes]
MRSNSPKKRLLYWKTNSEGLPDLAHLLIWRGNTWCDKCPIRQINLTYLLTYSRESSSPKGFRAASDPPRSILLSN